MLMATKIGRMVTYLKGLLSISYPTLWWRSFARSRDKLKPIFSTTAMPIATKRGKLVAYYEPLPPTSSDRGI